MSTNWKADAFAVSPTRRFFTLTARDGSSETIRSPLLGTPQQPLRGFVHWWAPVMANVWFREARRQMDIAKAQFALAGLTLPPPSALMTAYLAFGAAVNALNNGYNALNIPWYLHRQARELYWTWMSGPLNPVAIFNARANSVNYGGGTDRGWFTSGFKEPIITRESRGLIPVAARTLYASRQNDGVNNKFVQMIDSQSMATGGDADNVTLSQAQVDLLAAKRLTNDWYYQTDLKNSTGFVQGFGYGYYASTGLGGRIWWGDAWVVGDAHTPLTEANRLHDDGSTQDDPRSFRADFGIHFGDAAMRMSLGVWHYAGWIDGWIDTVLSQPLNEIVVSAREMAVYFNQGWISQTEAASAIMGQAARQYGQAASTDPGLQISVAVVSAAGAALASCTYGISAIVAGAYALGVTLGEGAAGPDVNRVTDAKDDLGRFKPIMERAWLSGNPADTTSGGMPRNAIPEIPAPAGTSGTRKSGAALMASSRPVISIGGIAPAPLLGTQQDLESASGVGMPVKLAAGAAAIALAVKIARSRSRRT